MTGSTQKSVFFVGMATHERDGLDTRLNRSGISVEYFNAAGPCQEALGARPCHLLVVSLGGSRAEALQLLADPRQSEIWGRLSRLESRPRSEGLRLPTTPCSWMLHLAPPPMAEGKNDPGNVDGCASVATMA